jgi:ABC-type polysaccharide/polyol phosphate export permease
MQHVHPPGMSIVPREIQRALVDEMGMTFNRLDLALHLAWTDTRTRYRRSVLGPFWLVIGTLIGVGGLGLVWSVVFQVDRETLIPMMATGLVIWTLLSASITEAASVFYTQRELFLNLPTASLFVSVVLLFRQLINFAHNLVVVVIVLLIYPRHLSLNALLVIPALALVALNLLWLIQFIGYVGARYRDLAPLLVAIMQPLFFVTPVLFQPQQLGSFRFIAEINPLAQWLTLIRDPLTGSAPPAMSWIASGCMALVGWSLALLITAVKRKRLVYWVH